MRILGVLIASIGFIVVGSSDKQQSPTVTLIIGSTILTIGSALFIGGFVRATYKPPRIPLAAKYTQEDCPWHDKPYNEIKDHVIVWEYGAVPSLFGGSFGNRPTRGQLECKDCGASLQFTTDWIPNHP